MKNILFLLSVLFITSCGCDCKEEVELALFDAEQKRSNINFIASTTAGSVVLTTNRPYNYETDRYIREYLSIRPLSVTRDSLPNRIVYEIYYPDLRIIARHVFPVPYESEEYWDFYANKYNGDAVIIQSSSDIWEHKISPEAYQQIKFICLTNNCK
ncbi:MAG: hypothetical protein H8E34_10895 [Bacteroidetes bacterium]|nr:hypothetical protein [Bacteroidota bacterium]